MAGVSSLAIMGQVCCERLALQFVEGIGSVVMYGLDNMVLASTNRVNTWQDNQ